jgi:3-phenylpropionate/trans-cinnamate dioxygenase ferredoxin subunit
VVDLARETVMVFRLGEDYYAVSHLCTHAEFGLEDAPCIEGVLTCPWHGARFSVRTGQVLSPPAFEDLQIYPVRVVEGRIEVLEGG